MTIRTDAEVIGLVSVAHGTSHFYHLILAPLFPWLKIEFGLSYAELGFLMTMFFVVSTIMQAAAGFWVDHSGPLKVLFFGVATLAISSPGSVVFNRLLEFVIWCLLGRPWKWCISSG